MSSLKQALFSVPAEIDDITLAQRIAAAMLESDRQPYCFSMDHDVRPPKSVACPINYDWALKKKVGIETLDRKRAEKWLYEALMRGYTVTPAGSSLRNSPHRKHHDYDVGHSLALDRQRAERHRMPTVSGDDDDDIPF